MDGQNESIILDVKLDAGRVAADLDNVSKEIERVKNAQKGLDAELKGGKISMAEYTKYSAGLKDELSWLQKQQKGLIATTKLMTEDTQTYSDTLNGQRQKLADMQKAYAQLDRVERESEGGKAFLKAINDQSEAVKELEAAMGDHRRNVGNYPKEITALVPGLTAVTGKMDAMTSAIDAAGKMTPKAMKDMAQGFKTATVHALKFIATPIGALLAGLAAAAKVVHAVFGRVAEAFEKNDEAGTKLARLFASFQPIVTAVGKAFDSFANVLGNAAEAIAGWIGAISDASKEAQNLVTAVDDLQEAERQYTENTARRSRDIARLRAEATESKDLEERERKLSEAIELERQDLEDRKEIAKERLRILEAEAKQNNDTSDAMKDKIAQARAAMYQAEEAYYVGTRKLQRELNSVQKEAERIAEQQAKEAADRRKEAQRRAEQEAKERERQAKEAADLAKKQADDERDIRRQAEDLAVQMIASEGERRLVARRLQVEREIEDLRIRLERETTLTVQAREELTQLIIIKESALQAELDKMRDDAAVAETEKEKKRQAFIAQQRLEAVNQMRQETDSEQTEYEKARFEAQKEVWRQQMESELAQIDLTNEERLALQAKWDAVIEAAERDHQNALTNIEKKANETRIANNRATAMAAAGFMGELSSILEQYGEQNKAAAVASKALALGKIGVETGVALASGIAQAQSVPFPANLAAIATTMTTILANVGTAISIVKGAKFSHGGVVEGRSYSQGGVVEGRSYSQGDIVPAMLSPTEVISNPKQAANLLYKISNNPAQGGIDYEKMANAIAMANRALPAPVLNYSEFEDFNQRRLTYNELAAI